MEKETMSLHTLKTTQHIVAFFLQGLTGPAGAAGAAGPQGVAGNAGAQGPAGVPGATGAVGDAGVDGSPGAAGADGAPVSGQYYTLLDTYHSPFTDREAQQMLY